MEPRFLVLVSDDDADTREMYQASLGLSGFRVEVAADGEEAWEKTRTLLPDVVVTDLTLPGLDGYGLCDRIRQDPRTADIPVIAVTGWAGKIVDERTQAAGFRASLLKPVLPEILVEEISKAIARAHSLRAKSDGVRSRVAGLLAKSGRLLAESSALRGTKDKTK